MEYAIKRELVQILGEIELQLGKFSKPVQGRQSKNVYLSENIEKIISDKYAELTDTQIYSITENMKIHHISDGLGQSASQGGDAIWKC